MEVVAASFPRHLLSLVVDISDADFVAFDFEHSGVPTYPAFTYDSNRPPLEQRYQEIREAAEQYRILQVGLTCAKWDVLVGTYVLRPYNISLSPIIDPKLNLDRDITFSSGAVDFLLFHHFDLNSPFKNGVRYLSRDEAALAKTIGYKRLENKGAADDLGATADDVASQDFMKRVREVVGAWSFSKQGPLDITASVCTRESESDRSLTRFERRIVHQLLRADFPDVVSFSRGDCVRVDKLNPDREANILKSKKRRLKEQIAVQTGFRWVIEALAKGSLQSIDPQYLARREEGDTTYVDVNRIRSKFGRAAANLQRHQPVLAGHNLFLDLVFMYRSFIGELPDTLDGFRDAVHDLFPAVVDTKFMATIDTGELGPNSSLQDLAKQVKDEPLPKIGEFGCALKSCSDFSAIHSEYNKYSEKTALHEAGYDSLLTAQVLIRLSTKLYLEDLTCDTKPKSDSGASYITAPEIQSRPIDSSATAGFGTGSVPEPISGAADAAPVVEPAPTTVTKPSAKKKRRTRKAAEAKPIMGRFAQATMFEPLRGMTDDSKTHSVIQGSKNGGPRKLSVDGSTPASTATIVASAPPAAAAAADGVGASGPAWCQFEDPMAQEDDTWCPNPLEAGTTMPAFGSPFWAKYENKLRVFGSKEKVLELDQ